LRQLPGVDEAGGDEIPGRIDEVVEVAGDDGAVTQVDSNEMVLQEVDDGGVVGVDER
jgi:acyl-coenzyme A synthetase/AMP-(fatty) acid ligase